MKINRHNLELYKEQVEEQLPLLQKCIKERWEKFAKGVYSGIPKCQLCERIESQGLKSIDNCGDCVIRIATGESQCQGTVYYSWLDGKNIEAAKIMLNDLKELENVLIDMGCEE